MLMLMAGLAYALIDVNVLTPFVDARFAVIDDVQEAYAVNIEKG